MNCEKCGAELRDMGHWPYKDMVQVIQRYHCPTCNTYPFSFVPDRKLIEVSPGEYEEVPA